ncbi:MAG: hypothetical protein M4579_000547 [Chaenotheca gracillima]|nr:MAG: hypothetical protein M4579_000547 [Chaenotheca gracillima]
MTPPNSAAAKAAQEGATVGGTEPLSSTDAGAAHEAILDADPRGGSSRLVSGVTGTATAHAPVQLPSAASTGGKTMKAIERWKAEMPTEAEMRPKDKYTMFDRKEKNYRKGIHKLPKWTRLSQRINPPGY